MTPNRRERFVERALRWARVRTRPGNYVKAFGWSRSAITDNDKATTAVLKAIREFSEASELDMFVGSVSRPQRSIRSMHPSEFRTAVSEPNELDAALGGVHIRAKSCEISIVIDWMRATNVPLTTIMTTIQEDWLDVQERVNLLTACLADVARGANHEYQVASHISDEVAKLGLGRGPRYETRPGAGVPYVPWWLVLGPAYVSVVGRESLKRLSPAIVTWLDGFASLRTSASPLLYGTAEAKGREASVRDALGKGLFIDSAGTSSIRPDYPVGYTVGPPQTGEIWDAYARGGKVAVVPRKET